jgi:methylated-DNA-[protein]-cysteine S-methyltransferase
MNVTGVPTPVMARIDSPVGELTIVASGDALRVLTWGGAVEKSRRVAAVVGSATAMEPAAHPILSHCVQQLDEYFAGTRVTFDLPLLADGTDFQLAAWSVLATIPYGQTMSYAQQAAQAGSPAATRAVGSANGRNPIAIVVPCHRVIGADGSLTGFGGGLDTKRWLLEHERAVVEAR